MEIVSRLSLFHENDTEVVKISVKRRKCGTVPFTSSQFRKRSFLDCAKKRVMSETECFLVNKKHILHFLFTEWLVNFL